MVRSQLPLFLCFDVKESVDYQLLKTSHRWELRENSFETNKKSNTPKAKSRLRCGFIMFQYIVEKHLSVTLRDMLQAFGYSEKYLYMTGF